MSENNNKQKRKRVCPHCGRKLWMREFYPLKNGGRSSWCHECVLVYKREQYRKHRKVADGTFMHRTLGRLVEHKGYSTRIFWNGNMLSIMRRHYHNTLNRELAVSRNARHECCVEVIYDSGNPSVLRTLLRSAVGEIIELC